jgi:hypothetical protein
MPTEKRQNRREDCRLEGFLNARRITVTGGRFLLNDQEDSF